MDKLMIAGIIAMLVLMSIKPGTPWVTPHDPGPFPVGPTLENPCYQPGTTLAGTPGR